MVSSANEDVCSSAHKDSEQLKDIEVTESAVCDSLASQQTPPPRLSCVRQLYEGRGLSEESVSIIMKSWRRSTHKQYGIYINKWFQFIDGKVDRSDKVSVNLVIEYLTSLHKSGLSYSALNTARSALSSFVCLDDDSNLGEHSLVKRFMRGVFNINPSFPRYSSTWDVRQVLDYLVSLGKNRHMSLLSLSMKLVMLLALVSGQRLQTLKALNIEFMTVNEHSSVIIFDVKKLMKQSRPGFHLKPLQFKHYVDNPCICVVSCILDYLDRTKVFRNNVSQLLISTQKPYKAVSTDTLARWLKLCLQNAKIDTEIYKAHSTRAASSSAAKSSGVPITTIMDRVGWTSAQTFAKYYDKNIESDVCFSSGILSKMKK